MRNGALFCVKLIGRDYPVKKLDDCQKHEKPHVCPTLVKVRYVAMYTVIDGSTFPLWHFICIIYVLMMYTLEFIRHMWCFPK